MNIDAMKRFLMVALFVGALGACGEQSSTEQTSEATGSSGATSAEADNTASGAETTN
jgi:hypothetical protein